MLVELYIRSQSKGIWNTATSEKHLVKIYNHLTVYFEFRFSAFHGNQEIFLAFMGNYLSSKNKTFGLIITINL